MIEDVDMTNENERVRVAILNAAYDDAVERGVFNTKRDAVAERAGVSYGQIHHYFKTMTNLRDAVMRKAIQTRCLSIIADGLAARNKYAQQAPEALKREALETLI